MSPTWTPNQLRAFTVSARTMSVLSITGSIFIMMTFIRFDYFRRPINRLVFYASFGNIMANVATLISTSALSAPGSPISPLCEFQGTLVQWFMAADSLWVFCMALNVMLVFFHSYSADQLRHLEKWYILISYGVPFVPAFAFIMAHHFGKQNIIGSATIWCWIGSDAEWMRIAFFYGPVWIVVCCTLAIYIITGLKIFRKRAVLRSFSRRAPTEPAPTINNPFTAGLSTIHVRNDISVHVTTMPNDLSDVEPALESPTCANGSRGSFSSTRNLSANTESHVPSARTRSSRVSWTNSAPATAEEKSPVQGSSYKATVCASKAASDLEACRRSESVNHSVLHIRRTAAMDGNKAAWGYFKVAFLMFVALFIVWVPSTINRLQQFTQHNKPIFGLNLASALVLPLQGFWNAMIYISTTWPECKRAFAEILDSVSNGKRNSSSDQDCRDKDSQHTVTSNTTQYYETEVPLTEMLKQTPRPHLHSPMSSSETMTVPELSIPKRDPRDTRS